MENSNTICRFAVYMETVAYKYGKGGCIHKRFFQHHLRQRKKNICIVHFLRLKKKYGIDNYIVYVGRIDENKG